jgi:uncharacterized protein with PIN domain
VPLVLKDKKNTEGCALQKNWLLTTKAMVRASAMVVLIRKEEERQRPIERVKCLKTHKIPWCLSQLVNSGFKIVITAKIKLRQQKKKRRQVCEFCDKQDSLKGSQLYRKGR